MKYLEDQHVMLKATEEPDLKLVEVGVVVQYCPLEEEEQCLMV